MTGNMGMMVAFIVPLLFLLIVLIKFKLSPTIALLSTTILSGILCGLDFPTIISSITTGFGGMLSSVGLVVGFGMVLGELLSKSGGAEELTKAMLRIVGKKKDFLALNITGYILSIPVYLLSAIVMLLPFAKSMAKVTKKSMAGYATALLIGLILTHSVVVPTPGPLAIAGMLNANIGWFLIYGLVITFPATIIAGWGGSILVDKWSKNQKIKKGIVEEVVEEEEYDLSPDPNKPSAKMTFLLILLPIVLILGNTFAGVFLPKENTLAVIMSFIGNNHIALFIGALTAMIALRKYFDEPINTVFEKSLSSVGSLFMLIGCGNALGTVFQAGGLGTYLIDALSGMNLSMLVLAFVLCSILRIAMGLGLVASITVVSMLGPTAMEMGVSPVLFGLVACCASFGFLGPFDPTFWMFEKFYDLDFKETLVSITIPTTVACLICFGMVMLLNAFSGVLPGLF